MLSTPCKPRFAHAYRSASWLSLLPDRPTWVMRLSTGFAIRDGCFPALFRDNTRRYGSCGTSCHGSEDVECFPDVSSMLVLPLRHASKYIGQSRAARTWRSMA